MNKFESIKKKLHSNNKSGFRGVSWKTKDKKWVAQIKINGKMFYIGGFDTPEEASKAYEEVWAKAYL